MSSGITKYPTRLPIPPARSAGPFNGLAPSREVQELWFSTLRRPWRTLVIVPAHVGGSALPLARALAQVGGMHRGRPLRVICAEGMDLGQIADLIPEISMMEASGPSDPGCIVALDPIVSNPLGTAVALAADAVLLCVEYGASDLDVARRTIEQIGHERFIGCAVLKPR